MSIQIKTLGHLEIRLGDRELTGLLDQPVRTALLLHLALELQVTREEAMVLLWPERDPDRARHTLSQTLYRLRKDLGDDWLDVDGERLQVTDAVTVDVHRFQSALDEDELPAALGLYRGPFLAGWKFPGTGQFESWVDNVRIRLSRQFRDGNRKLVSALRGSGDAAGALDAARAWVEAEPLDDEAQHALLELLVETGNRAEALSRFEAYERMLAIDDLTPLDHTQALVASIRRNEVATPQTEARSDGQEAPDADSAAPEAVRATPVEYPPSSPATTLSGPASWWSGRRWIAIGALGALILASMLIWMPDQSATGPPLLANRVLVVSLENQTGDPALDPVGRLAADWITQGLSSSGFLEVVPTIEVVPDLQPDGDDGGGALARALDVARENQAGTTVYGTYYRRDQGLEFHVQIAAVPTGRLLQTVGPVRSATIDPMQAVDVLRERTMIAMAVRLDVRLEGMLGKATLPPTYESYLAYVRGFELFGLGRRAEAIPFLVRAHELSPAFTAPLIMAGFGHASLRNYPAAESLAVLVRGTAESLTPYDRYRLEFLESNLRGDLAGSLRATKAAAALQPGGTAHAAAGNQALYLNRPREALEILSTLRRDGLVAEVYLPLWNTTTTAHHSLGEHRQELEAAVLGRSVQPFSLAMIAFEVRALAALGRIEQVEARLEECVNLPTDQYGWTPADVMLEAARELRVHGHPGVADTAVINALAWYEGRPADEQETETHLRGLAQAMSQALRWGEAHRIHERLLDMRPGRVDYIGGLGVLAARLGNQDEARRHDERLAELTDPYLFGRQAVWRARIAAQLGGLEDSLTLLRRAFAEGTPFPYPLLHTDPDFDPLRNHPGFLELMRPKG